MLDIACDECGKKYRVDETKMRSARAKAKCRACSNIMVVTHPQAAARAEPPRSVVENQPPVPADIPEPPPARSESVPRSVVDRFVEPAKEKPTEPVVDASAYLSGPKIRFGLFGKIIIVMLIVSLVPLAVFLGITFWETNDRVRIETENLMAQTAGELGTQVDGWLNNNVSILRTAAKLPAIVSMDSIKQEKILKVIQKEYPWMHLVFTVGPDGMNVARNDGRPLKDYSDRQYYKDILAGKKLSWQTLIGKTSQKPALVLAVPIKSGDNLLGALAAAMTVDEISNNIATWRKGQPGLAFLVDEKGFVISHPDNQYVTKRKNLNRHPLIAGFRKKGWRTMTSKFNTPNGETALGHVSSTDYGWVLVLQQQSKEPFESFNRVQEIALILLAGTVLLVLIIAWISVRTIVRPIRKLTEAAERLSLGELNVKIDIKSKDEIGLLAQAIGRMQTSLRMAMNDLRHKR